MPDRFARTAERFAARQDARAAALAERVRSFVAPRGDERALDVGTGAGALALALAPLVREVVGIDRVPELLALARERASAGVTFGEGDAESLPFDDGAFDLATTLRTLHHVERPERVVAEMARVTRPGGRMLVADQLAPDDPDEAAAVHRFEKARDPGHARLLSEAELEALFDANGLVVVRDHQDLEQRDLAAYLDIAGCEGEDRARAVSLVPGGTGMYLARLGWYLLEQRTAESPSGL